ncbi:MAG: pseudouridine synthase [Rickettsiales bacterium]|nr:pseudouridine synthase [Rickettsiales bacterium]
MKSQKVRIAKILSHAGICSRREAEILVKEGKVELNGEIFKEFSIEKYKIKKICVLGKELKKPKTRIWFLNKPVGYVCSNKEQENQKSLFRLLSKDFPRVVSVGRLDINSEGLIILTNNPSISSFLERPSNKVERIYIVDVKGNLPNNFFNIIKKKINVENIIYEIYSLDTIYSKNFNHQFKITLYEGKKREIRNIMNFFGLKVLKLKRIQFGPFLLENLEEGNVKEIEEKKINNFLKQLNFSYENNFW